MSLFILVLTLLLTFVWTRQNNAPQIEVKKPIHWNTLNLPIPFLPNEVLMEILLRLEAYIYFGDLYEEGLRPNENIKTYRSLLFVSIRTSRIVRHLFEDRLQMLWSLRMREDHGHYYRNYKNVYSNRWYPLSFDRFWRYHRYDFDYAVLTRAEQVGIVVWKKGFGCRVSGEQNGSLKYAINADSYCTLKRRNRRWLLLKNIDLVGPDGTSEHFYLGSNSDDLLNLHTMVGNRMVYKRLVYLEKEVGQHLLEPLNW